MNKQIEQTLDSREVAEMLGKRHDNLLQISEDTWKNFHS